MHQGLISFVLVISFFMLDQVAISQNENFFLILGVCFMWSSIIMMLLTIVNAIAAFVRNNHIAFGALGLCLVGVSAALLYLYLRVWDVGLHK